MPARVLLTVAALVAALLPAGAHAQASAPPGRVTFPSNALTVPDSDQATGRRVNLPLPDCTVHKSTCNEIRLVNTLDGFDLDPRVSVALDAPPEGLPATPLEEVFTPEVLYVEPVAGGERIPLTRLVYDPDATTLYAHPRDLLDQATTYRVVYRDSAVEFTTMTATAGLEQIRRQLDDGTAYDAVGIAADNRAISFTQGDLRTVFPAGNVRDITRYNEVIPGGELRPETVINTARANASTYAFGHVLAPSWLLPDRTIAPAGTAGPGPRPVTSEQVGITLILPNGTRPAGGWPVAIFGPGITRSKYDVFLAADFNAARGIATMSFDPAGHAYGPRSEVGVTQAAPPGEVRFLGFGRGRDYNNDGVITNREGVDAPVAPHPKTPVALRDGLRQTVADLMTIMRAVRQGVDVDGDGTTDLSTEEIEFYAQSLGGIYGTMFMAVEPHVPVGVLNVPGGPIVDIARLAPGFRREVGVALRNHVPALLNGGINGFTESLPVFGQPPVPNPAAGAIAIQETLARTNWIDRPGSPEAFAPHIKRQPLDGAEPKNVVYQFAHGDQTVPNPTSATLARAFGDLGAVAFYRNDRTATAPANPHGFLLDPRIQGRDQAQIQVTEYLASDGAAFIDPDGPAPTWEVPIADLGELEQLNFPTSLYAPERPPPSRAVERHGGPNRVATATQIAKATFDSADTVVIARADAYADALAGGPLAVSLNAPLLLSASEGLSQETAEEIRRLEASDAVLLGGESALSQKVADDLEAQGLSTRRISGPNRFATAVQIAAELGYSSEVLVAEGASADPTRGWPDALAASALGSGLRQPILLVTRDRLPDETRDLLVSTQDVTIIGGRAAVSDAVAADMDARTDHVRRLAGSNRYETSVLVLQEAFLRGLDPTVTWLATGRSFADGLVAGAAAGVNRGMLLLIDGETFDAETVSGRWLRDHARAFDQVKLAGGTAAIHPRPETAVRAVVAGE